MNKIFKKKLIPELQFVKLTAVTCSIFQTEYCMYSRLVLKLAWLLKYLEYHYSTFCSNEFKETNLLRIYSWHISFLWKCNSHVTLNFTSCSNANDLWNYFCSIGYFITYKIEKSNTFVSKALWYICDISDRFKICT